MMPVFFPTALQYFDHVIEYQWSIEIQGSQQPVISTIILAFTGFSTLYPLVRIQQEAEVFFITIYSILYYLKKLAMSRYS